MIDRGFVSLTQMTSTDQRMNPSQGVSLIDIQTLSQRSNQKLTSLMFLALRLQFIKSLNLIVLPRQCYILLFKEYQNIILNYLCEESL